MLSSADQEAVRAALVWDVPYLRRSGVPGAPIFLDAFDLRMHEDVDGADPLSVAGRGVLAEMSGDVDGAKAAYEHLVAWNDDAVGLLGHFLRCWSATATDPGLIDEGLDRLRLVDDAVTQARLISKLIAAAFHHGWDECIGDLFTRATALAPDGSMLRAMLSQEAVNLVGEPLPREWAYEVDDELTAYPWITDLVASSAADAMVEAVEDRARSPWTLTLKIGGGNPLRRAYAAELQARWAGAIWLRRQVQRHLAAQLLTGGASTPEDYVDAVVHWAMSRSTGARRVAQLAEPGFDDSSADLVLERFTRSDRVAQGFNTTLVELAVEMWDLMSKETAVRLLDRFPPSASDHPIHRNVATLWSVLSLRVPGEWLSRFGDLSDDRARALLATTTPAVAERLPAPAAERLSRLADEVPLTTDAIVLAGALLDRSGAREELDLEGYPAVTVVRLARETQQHVGRDELDRAVGQLAEEIQRVVSDAQRGNFDGGGYNAFALYAQGLLELGSVPNAYVAPLVDIAMNASLPRDLRYDAASALVAVAAQGEFGSSDLSGVARSIPEAGAEPIWGEYSRRLMQTVKAQLGMAAGDVAHWIPQVVVLARDLEPRVRMAAIDACLLGRRQSDDEMLESALLSGLFDPETDVVEAAVNGLADSAPVREAAQYAIADRLETLFQVSERRVRASIAQFVALPLPEGPVSRIAPSLQEAAASDRSYQVREAARREIS